MVREWILPGFFLVTDEARTTEHNSRRWAHWKDLGSQWFQVMNKLMSFREFLSLDLVADIKKLPTRKHPTHVYLLHTAVLPFFLSTTAKHCPCPPLGPRQSHWHPLRIERLQFNSATFPYKSPSLRYCVIAVERRLGGHPCKAAHLKKKKAEDLDTRKTLMWFHWPKSPLISNLLAKILSTEVEGIKSVSREYERLRCKAWQWSGYRVNETEGAQNRLDVSCEGDA